MLRTIRQLSSALQHPEIQVKMGKAGKKVQELIEAHPVMVFSKSYCPFCDATKQTLDILNHAKYKVVELDKESDGKDMQDALEELTGQRTVPNVFIMQKHIGGNSDVQTLQNEEKLAVLLKKAGAI